MALPGLQELIFRLPALIAAIVFHEYAHARAADALGDPTPRHHGRLTLNPMAHLDPIGLLMLLVFRFGWARPVPVNPLYFRDGRRGMMLVSLAGPMANVVMAFLAILVLRLIPLGTGGPIVQILVQFQLYNIILAVFNLLPVPPLDGSKILAGLLPAAGARLIYSLEQYGFLILILLIWTGGVRLIIWPMATMLNSGLVSIVRVFTGI